ncbi:unnamed protein product [Protopolystoma xenopodis]|uniref:Uncharacterized protein n=1 Tax=Protopolystoma xenopodis TaxID=117903 RepID=A0A448XLT2_9PLAT|nr:unnamed protein product [Protopolystoma xenopodis]
MFACAVPLSSSNEARMWEGGRANRPSSDACGQPHTLSPACPAPSHPTPRRPRQEWLSLATSHPPPVLSVSLSTPPPSKPSIPPTRLGDASGRPGPNYSSPSHNTATPDPRLHPA